MGKLYLISSIAALAFFSYAQHQGMTLTGNRSGQQLASSGTGAFEHPVAQITFIPINRRTSWISSTRNFLSIHWSSPCSV